MSDTARVPAELVDASKRPPSDRVEQAAEEQTVHWGEPVPSSSPNSPAGSNTAVWWTSAPPGAGSTSN